MIRAVMGESIVKRGVDAGYLEINYVQIRDFTENKQKKVDDYPYGGGPGLIMQYQPIVSAYESVSKTAKNRTAFICPLRVKRSTRKSREGCRNRSIS